MSSETVDALVIGGGIVGCGVAYYLAREGVKDVLLVEGEEHGAGATGGSFGNIRQQYGTPLEIECSRRGLKWWKSAESEFGVPVVFHEDGYLMLTAEERTAATLEQHAQLQREMGMPDIELLGPGEVKELVPFVEPQGLIYGSYTPKDGHVLPMDGLAAYAHRARDLGARIRRQWPVDRVERRGSEWHAVGPKGTIAARRVVIAAGAGTKELVAPFGIDLDIRAVTHHSVLTGPAYRDRTVPFTVDLDCGLAVEREGQGLVLAMLGRNPAPRDHDHLIDLFSTAAERRAPALLNLEITNRMTAYPTIGGDGHPYIGQVDDGLWAIAFVGHGAMHGPPVAEAIAREAVGRPDETLDLSPWDLRRAPGQRTVLWRRNATN